jgi:TP901 family phage tail tape measure protein
MALNAMGLGFIMTARDMASRVFQRIGRGLRTLGKQGGAAGMAVQAGLGVATAGVIALGVGLGTLMGTFVAARAAGAFEQTMARVGAISRATASEMRDLSEAALEAGIRTQFSPREAAEGLAELAARGFQADESIRALNGTLDLAQGGQISVAQAASTMGAAVRAFALDTNQATLAADKLLRISNVTALQANDLELALGNVARGATVARQSIDEMLPSIGLVRNSGVQASVAASSVSSALIFMAKNADRFDAVLGRTNALVDESTGEFRDFLDVVLETSTALEDQYTNQADRARVATELFGRFGLTAFSAISRQLTTGIRNARGQIVRGAEAVQFLRKTMAEAAGAAQEFRERLQNTFEGQVTLLRGVIQTLTTVVGGPFGRAFMPILRLLRGVLTGIIRFFQIIPEEAGTAIATLIIFAGVLATAFGGITLLGIGVAILIPFLKAAAIIIAAMTVTLVAFGAAISSAVVAVGALWLAARRNIGGFGTFLQRQFQRMRLIFTTLVDLFTHGGVRAGSKILAPQNRGLLQFALNVFAIGQRIINFVRGIGKGFVQGMESIQPAIEGLMSALRELGDSFGFMGSESTRAGIQARGMQDFFRQGASIGQRLARVLEFMVNALRRLTHIITGFIRGYDTMMRAAQPGIILMRAALQEFGEQLSRMLTPLLEMLGVSDETNKTFQSVGGTLAWLAGVMIGAFANGISIAVRTLMFLINTVRFLNLSIQSFGRIAALVTRGVGDGFQTMVDVIIIALQTLISHLGQVAQMIPPQFRPTFLNDLIVAGQRAEVARGQRAGAVAERIAGFRERAGAAVPEAEFRQVMTDFGRTFTAGAMGAARAARPGVAAVEAAGPTTVPAGAMAGAGGGVPTGRIDEDAIKRAIISANVDNTRAIAAAIKELQLKVEVDGEGIASTNRSRAEAAGRQVGMEP